MHELHDAAANRLSVDVSVEANARSQNMLSWTFSIYGGLMKKQCKLFSADGFLQVWWGWSHFSLLQSETVYAGYGVHSKLQNM